MKNLRSSSEISDAHFNIKHGEKLNEEDVQDYLSSCIFAACMKLAWSVFFACFACNCYGDFRGNFPNLSRVCFVCCILAAITCLIETVVYLSKIHDFKNYLKRMPSHRDGTQID